MTLEDFLKGNNLLGKAKKGKLVVCVHSTPNDCDVGAVVDGKQTFLKKISISKNLKLELDEKRPPVTIPVQQWLQMTRKNIYIASPNKAIGYSPNESIMNQNDYKPKGTWYE